MNHWNLFKESWRIFWRNPALWVFGLLAALGGGTNLRYNFNFDFGNNNFDPEFLQRFGASRTTHARDAVRVSRAAQSDLQQPDVRHHRRRRHHLDDHRLLAGDLCRRCVDGHGQHHRRRAEGGRGIGFRAGAKRFLPLLGVRFILALPALILGILSAIVHKSDVLTPGNDLGSMQAFTRNFSAISGLGALAFVLSLLMMAIGVSAERAVVLDEAPIWPSIVKGWKFLWGKFGDYFTIVLLFILVGIAAGLVFACILIPILCGTLGLGAASAFSDNDLSVVHAPHGLHRPDDSHRRAAGLVVRHAGQHFHVQCVDAGLSAVDAARAAGYRSVIAGRADRSHCANRTVNAAEFIG